MAEQHPRHRAPHRDDFPGEGAARGTARLEAFADAVFAIAFTLPIVEIKVPHGDEPLTAQLAELWPSYLAYAISSLVIGIYWIQHHFSGAIYRTSGHWFNVATVLFLTAIGFIDFPARAFAEHLPDPDGRGPAAIFFVAGLALTGVTWWIKWKVGRSRGHVDARLEPHYVDCLNRRYNVSTVLLIVAAALALIRWEVGLALASAVTLFYLLAPPTPVYTEEAPIVEGEESA
ncbi:MAG: TMEM175 family protein [Allosphingosinicella sp.]|uniref:TMEM175 family protein n=1 Tax=Allosphingosinicella sp. TaxID=2823234 RepID=UPI003933523C